MDSGSDEQQVRDELLRQLLDLQAELTEERAKGKWRPTWYKIANSPLAITLVSGIFVAIITSLWQTTMARIEREEIRQHELQQSKRELLTDFANDFVASLTYANRFKEREEWLIEQQHVEEKGRFSDGRSFEDTVSYWEAMRDKYVESPNSDTLCAMVRAVYDTEPVRSKGRQLDEVMDKLITATTMGEVRSLFAEADALYQELLDAMGAELKSGN